jgi:PAS domain S-box-containing protein
MSETAPRPDGSKPPRRLRIADDSEAAPNRDVTWDVLSEKINDLIVLADVSGVMFYASPACRNLGYAQHEMIGRTAGDFVHPDDLAHFQANGAALFGGAPYDGPPDREHRVRCKDGSWVWMEGSPSLIHGAHGETIGIINIFRDVTDRRAVREALNEQARRAAMAEAVAGVGYWRLDVATEKITWSEQMFRIWGLEPGVEPPLAAAMAMTHPDDRAEGAARLQQALATGQGWTDDLTRIVRPDGQTRYVNGRGVCETGAAGHVTAVFGTVMDVTEQRNVQLELEQQTQRAALAETVAGAGYWRFDTLTGKLTCSDGMLRIYGLGFAEDPNFERGMAMTHPEDKAAADARWARALAVGEGWSGTTRRIIRDDGEVRHISGNCVCETQAGGRVTAIFGTIMDVTDQRTAQLKLHESEARYRLITETATDMISHTSCRDGRLTYLSPAVERITGYTPAELVGQRMQAFVHPDDLPGFIEAFGDLMAGARPEGRAIRFRSRHKDGAWLWLESNPRLVRAPDGTPTDIIDVTRNVGEQEALRARLTEARGEAETLAAVKSEFLANMSHEIRTPLTAVLGFTGLLEERGDLTPEAAAQVGRIAGAGRALLAIVNDVLDFSKLEAGEMTITPCPTDAGMVAREVLEMFVFQAKAKSLALRFDAVSHIPACVSIDADRLRQILTNLIGNALKFTEEGTVTVRLGYDKGAERLSVDVADTGPGIAAGMRERLFQRFSQIDGSSTRTKGGTGLGLAICRSLAEAMGGSVTLRSRVGRGSTFRVELAAPITEAILLNDAGRDHAASLDGIRVLVADDNRANRELARAILEPAGAEVSEACDGAEAIATALTLPVDVILMDLHMPGVGGRAATAEIRRGGGPNQDVPILAFSADSEVEEDGLSGSRLFDGQVNKPVSPHQLLNALRQAVFDGPAPQEEARRHA